MADGFTIDIRHDLKDLRRALTRYERQALPAAARQGLNRAAASARAAAVKAMARDTGIKQKTVRAGLTLKKAGRTRLEARIAARGRPFNVIRFMTPAQINAWVNSQKRPRPALRAKVWGVRRAWRRRVFVGNEGRTVFIREGAGRATVRGLYGPSVGRELVRETTREAAMRRFRERFPVELHRALANELRKLGFR